MKTRVCFENIESVLRLKVRKNCLRIKKIDCIEMKDVSFSYGANHFVFRDFNCILERGEAVRIAGANGSGKSTFAKIICGLYAPQMGEILFDGKPSNDIAQEDINACILYISQEEPLLNEKLSSYLSLIAGRELNDGEFINLCNATGFDEGDVRISEKGKSLSPGQRKKIMMMKYLLLKDRASVIVLDEAFAGLDESGRDKFSNMLNRDIAKRNKIYIIVEHMDVGVNVSRVVNI